MKIKIKRKLKEMSSMGGGAVQGYAGSPLASKEENEKFNKKQEEEQRLKGQKLAEMYSSSALSGRNRIPIVSGEEEHAGHVERSKHQGLRNVMEAEKRIIYVKINKKIDEKIKKVGNEYAVYPKKGGKRLGTHPTKEKAQKMVIKES